MEAEHIPDILNTFPGILDTFNEGFYVLDEDWRYVYVNQRAAELVGKPRSAMIGQKFWQMFPEVLEQPFAGKLRKAMQEHTQEQIETFYPPLQKWFMCRCYPIDSHLVVIVQDITENKLTKTQLEVSNIRLSLVLDSIALGQWYGDLATGQLIWNDMCKMHSGLSVHEEVSVETFYAHIHPEDREHVRLAIEQAIQKRTDYNIAYRTVTQNGRVRWLRAIGHCFYNEQGVPLHFDGVTMDITERELAREQLREKAALLNLSYDAIIVHNYEGRILFWNRGAEELYGWSATEAMEKDIHKLLSTQFSQTLDNVRAQVLHKGRWEGELIHRRKDGSRIHVDSRWAMLKNIYGQDVVFLETNRDITERKDLERRKNEFISMASHELKTPITSIKAFTQLLMKRLQPLGDRQIDNFLGKMNDQINRLTRLVNELLDVSRMETGKLTFHDEVFDLHELILTTVANMQPAAGQHKLLYNGIEGVKMRGDQGRIEQVLINLLNNAIKYSPRADKVLIRLSTTQENATVSIQDFGIGIDPINHQKIFERFYQAEPVERNFPGLGIGLYICHEVLQRHHGRLWVESQLGAGATFLFTLPLWRPDVGV